MYKRIVCLGGLFKPPFCVVQLCAAGRPGAQKEVSICKFKCYNMERYILITKEILEGRK